MRSRVRNAALVRVGEARADLAAQHRGVADVEPSVLAPQLRDGAALEQLHGDEVGVVFAVRIEDGDDVAMVQRRHGASLAYEQLDDLRVVPQVLGQLLQRDHPAEPAVSRLEHDGHSTAADLLQDLVAPGGLGVLVAPRTGRREGRRRASRRELLPQLVDARDQVRELRILTLDLLEHVERTRQVAAALHQSGQARLHLVARGVPLLRLDRALEPARRALEVAPLLERLGQQVTGGAVVRIVGVHALQQLDRPRLVAPVSGTLERGRRAEQVVERLAQLGRVAEQADLFQVLGGAFGAAAGRQHSRLQPAGQVVLTVAVESLRGRLEVSLEVGRDRTGAALEDDVIGPPQVDRQRVRLEVGQLELELGHAVAAPDRDAVGAERQHELRTAAARKSKHVGVPRDGDRRVLHGSRIPDHLQLDRAGARPEVEPDPLGAARPDLDLARLEGLEQRRLGAGLAKRTLDREPVAPGGNAPELGLARDRVVLASGRRPLAVFRALLA